MKNEKQLELSQFQEISQQMLTFAETNEWDKLSDLETERKKVMQSFFEESNLSRKLSLQGLSAQDSAQVEQAIKKVLSMNDKIAQLAEEEKTAIGSKVQGLKKRQNVHSAYLQNKS